MVYEEINTANHCAMEVTNAGTVLLLLLKQNNINYKQKNASGGYLRCATGRRSKRNGTHWHRIVFFLPTDKEESARCQPLPKNIIRKNPMCVRGLAVCVCVCCVYVRRAIQYACVLGMTNRFMGPWTHYSPLTGTFTHHHQRNAFLVSVLVYLILNTHQHH